MSVQENQCFRDHLQTVPGVAFVASAAEKPRHPDPLSFACRVQRSGFAAHQNHGDPQLNISGVTVFLLPGAVLKPDSLAGHPGRSTRHRFKGDDNAGQFAEIVLGNQLATSSFSVDFASGDGSVTALSRRITR